MKPISLEFCGVNSFSERTEIDFTKLTEYGIFGIFGDTGSGKSSILDCISFALYGDVARAKGSLAEMINYRSDKAFVNFEFEIYYEGVRRTFRVEREIKKKNAVQSVRVYERKGETLTALSEGVRESNALLYKIIGLEQRDFEKCIALPQGEFAQFVKAPRADRLKLVARLFNLEKYGEALFKRTNARFSQKKEDVRVLCARLEPYGDISATYLKTLKEEIARLEAEEKELQNFVSAKRDEEKTASALFEKCEERDRLSLKMQRIEEKKAEMKALDSALVRLEKAAAVVACLKEREAAAQKHASDSQTLERASRALSAAKEELQKLAVWDEKKYEEETERLSALLLESKSAAFARTEYEEDARRMEKVLREQAEEAKLFSDFSYEEESARIEERLRLLGDDGDFMSFVSAYGKSALLRAEYSTFAGELTDLTQKHPAIGDDSAPLIQKYRALSEGEKTDFSALRAEYDRRKREREELAKERLALEKRKSRYDIHLNALQTLSTEYKRLSERMRELKTRFEGKELPERIEERLRRKRDEKREHDTRLRSAEETFANANLALTAAQERLNASKEAQRGAEERLLTALEAGGFEAADEARTLLTEYGNAQDAKRRVEEYKEVYAAVRSRLRELSALGEARVTQEQLNTIREELSEGERRLKSLSEDLAVKRVAYGRAQAQLEEKKKLEAALQALQVECERYERLKKLLEGNKFMEFVAEEYLQTVAGNASKRLLSLTGGRYFLKYAGGFVVGDNFDGGNTRAVATLSGGETFLVSLSLAVALSAEICARSLRPIEFFFLDEGFGTLDEKLVDVVMDSLEKLKGEHLTVGIISHVEELKHRIDRKLTVIKATEKRGSQILTE